MMILLHVNGGKVPSFRSGDETVKELPFRSLTALSSGEVGNNQRDGILLIVNDKTSIGIIKF